MSDTKKKKSKAKRAPRRQERRFMAVSAHNKLLVRGLGALGAAGMGAGAWAHLYGQAFATDEQKAIPVYIVAAGAVLAGVAIWLGTTTEPALRVGDPGIAIERGDLRRMPWHAVQQITWQEGTLSLVVTGRDETGKDLTLKVPLNGHAEAIGWILDEAERRVPKTLEIDDGVLEKLPGASEHAGQRLDLEALQAVGKKCSASGKTISYEPDARICSRCERVFHKASVPKKCKCGASLAHLRSKFATDDEDDTGDDTRDDDEDGSEERRASSRSKTVKAEAEEDVT